MKELNISVKILYDRIRQIWMPLAAVIFWGLSFIATKVALQEISPEMIIVMRLLLSVPLIGIFAVFTKKSFKLTLNHSSLVFLLASVSAIHLLIQVTGLKYTTAANTGWIIGTAPVFITILSRIFLKEILTAGKITGIIICIFGLLLLISKGDIYGLSFVSGKGDLLVLGSSFTWAVYSIINRKISLNYSAVISIFYLFLFMTFIILPFNLTEKSINSVMNLSFNGWTAVLFLGIFCSGISYLLWAKALSTNSSVNVGSVLYIEPFITFLGAWLLLGEPITLITIISGIIIMTGVAVVNR